MKRVFVDGLASPTAVIAAAMTCATIAGPVAAQSRVVTPPASCEAYLTVQSRSCVVSHHWRCAGDPEGTQWTLSMDEDGAFDLSQTDAEYRWLVTLGLRSGLRQDLTEPEQDPASFSELLNNGADSYVFTLDYGVGNGVLGQVTYSGFDRLTGEEVVIDGQRLLRTEFALEYDFGDGMRRLTGHQYISPEYRLFFSGVEQFTDPDGAVSHDDGSPVDFITPGEPGFLSATPLYDCGEVMS